MIFSCESQLLNNALSIVSHSLAVRSPNPILEGVLLESCEEGIHLTCTDGTLGIETTIPAEVAEEGRCVLPGKLFCEAIRKMPGGKLNFSMTPNLQVTVSCMSFRMTMTGMDAMEYPELPEVEGERFTISQGLLREMIGGTLFATAVDESRPILTGCLLEMTEESISLVALDGFRLAIRREPIHGPEHNVQTVLGGRALTEISRVLSDGDEELTLNVGKSHTEFILGETRIIARSLEGEFIRYRQILPTEWKTQTIVNRRDLESAIDRASLIAREGKSNLVRFRIEGEELIVTSNSETSDTEECITGETMGSGLTIAFNIRYITDVLKVLNEDRVVMRFNSNVSPCVITPEQGEKYLYLVLPVRVFGA
ncbi:MAG: DNA polymerase III subunit beta [Clostridiales bacterium]|nr:DNA polymerase III subunit beta [Clostridiales bacterium]